MFQFIIKSIIYCLLLLFSLPLIFSVLFLGLTISNYVNSEKIEGTVVSCILKTRRTNSVDYPDRLYKVYYKQVKTKDGSIVVGNYGYDSEDSCGARIEEKVKVLKNGNKKEIYTFEDFFIAPLLYLIVCCFIYGTMFLGLRRYKKLSKIKKPT